MLTYKAENKTNTITILGLNVKYYGIICDCGAEDCYPTNYLSIGAPNIKCKTCGKEWITSPTTKLHIY